MARRSASLLVVGLLVGLASSTFAAEPVDYTRQIRPILQSHCFKCHSEQKQQGDLRLDSVAAALQGGNSGPAIVPGKSSESVLVEAITGGPNASAMPPEGAKLSAEQIALIKLWIDQGAKPPADDAPIANSAKRSDHWAFQPLQHPATPQAQPADWAHNPIDQFILARLNEAKIKPAPEADPATLIRRLSLDLIGLPPSPEEVEAFVTAAAAKPSAGDNAYLALVDRLLASPHYGERWGRHWLDLARYADSNGYTIDSARSIWKYRDWVIDALNRDMPFDQFTIEQIAGDMLPKATNDQIVATGFHRNTMKNEEGGTDAEQFRVDAVADRVNTTGSVFLGLTLGCARCHDHKYDPISQREFYQFFALLNNADEPILSLPTNQQSKELPAIQAEIEAVERRLAEVDNALDGRQKEWELELAAQIAELEKSGTASAVVSVLAPFKSALKVPREKRKAADKKLLLDEFKKVDPQRLPLIEALDEVKARQKQLQSKITTTLVMRERDKPRETFVHLRGDFLRTGARVEPGVPAVLATVAPMTRGDRPATRLDLARWLVDPKNPLTPRVTVNRLWQAYFGIGLVATENDFGTQGDRPTHPELLDWLASEFVARQWSLKETHRLIVTSATYRQSSHARPELRDKDPYNKLLARQTRLRLDAEVIRDSALAASGLLSREIGGPGVYPPQPDGIYRFTQNVKYWKESSGEDRYRRAMYTYYWRSSPYPFLATFDAPDATNSCTRRVRSNTPLQALTLANDRAFVEMAQGLAARVLREVGSDDDRGRIRRAVQLCLCREPTAVEIERLTGFVAAQRAAFDSNADEARQIAAHETLKNQPPIDAAAWTALARVLLNLDEFVTRE